MSKKKPYRPVRGAAVAGALLSCGNFDLAFADGTRADDDAQLAQVVVTAQHRVENLQDVPISALVIGGQARLEQNQNSLNELFNSTPAVHVGSSGRSNNLYIRGIGSGENQSFDQSVGIFIDDVYHGRSRMSTATFLDVERVEVLKGPQSIFFGNNAIAGAVNVITRKPADRFDAFVRALYSPNGDLYAFEGAVGGALTDKFAVRGAASVNGQSGWLENTNLGRHIPDESNEAARLTGLFSPMDALNMTLKVEGTRNRSAGALPLQIVGCPPAEPFAPTGFCNQVVEQSLPTGLDANKNSESSGPEISLDTKEAVLALDYRQWGHTFSAVSGYYDYDYNFKVDTDGVPATLLHGQVPEHYHQFSQELRIASATGQVLEYLGGIYFQADDLDLQQDLNFSFLDPVVQSVPPLASLIPLLPLGQQINYSQTERSYSVFGSLTWNVTDRFKVSGGLRGSRVEKDYDWNLIFGTATGSFGDIAPLPPNLVPLANALGLGMANTLSEERSDHAWMPSVRAQYSIRPGAMIYASYARGFKAGGFNGLDNTGAAENLPFGPEYVNSYELGLKSEWLDDRLLVNAAIFRSDYSDLQVAVNIDNAAGTFVTLVKNAAKSKAQGVELETRWALGRSIRLSAQASYLDSHYVSYPNAGATQAQQLSGHADQDLSGAPTEFAPKWSGGITGSYTASLPGSSALTFELSTYFSSRYFLNAVNDSLIEQGTYGRLDARIGLASADGRWNLDVIGKNLTDRRILLFGTNYPTASGSVLLQKEQPRNAAIQLRYQW